MGVSGNVHRGEPSRIRKWELSFECLSACPSEAADVLLGFCWSFTSYLHSEMDIHVLHGSLNKALFFFVSLLFCYKHKILSERYISSPLALQFFVHFRCRQAGVWVGSFWPYFSIGHGLQLCFPYLWLELITAASTMHEREESWRYLSAVVETKWENRQKRTELLFEADGCWVNSFATC